LWDVVCRSNVLPERIVGAVFVAFPFPIYRNEKITYSCGQWYHHRFVAVYPKRFCDSVYRGFLYLLRSGQLNFAQVFKIGIVATLTFVLTFLPFVYNHMADFMVMNPFVIQSSFLMPLGWSLGCIALSLLGYFVVKIRLT
jgi:hypothetical protein